MYGWHAIDRLICMEVVPVLTNALSDVLQRAEGRVQRDKLE